MSRSRAFFTCLFTVVVTSCGSSNEPATSAPCVEGQSSACVAPSGCSGFQVCQSDGTFGACTCVAGDSAIGDTAKDTTTPSDSSSETVVDSTLETGSDTSTPTDSGSSDVADTMDAADTGPITPADLPGLSLWLIGDKGVTTCPTGDVGRWADQSTNANDAKRTCSSGGGGPVVLPSDVGGHDALKFGVAFSRLTMQIDDATSLQFGTGAFAIVAVVSAPAGTTGTDLFYKPDPAAPATHNELRIDVDANLNALAATAAAHAFFPDTGYHAMIVRGPALQIRIDGSTTTGTTSTADISAPGSGILIGTQVADYMSMKELRVAELIAVKGGMTDEQVAGIESYLKTRYKLSF